MLLAHVAELSFAVLWYVCLFVCLLYWTLAVDNRYSLLSTVGDDGYTEIVSSQADAHGSTHQTLSSPSSAIHNTEQNVKESKQLAGFLDIIIMIILFYLGSIWSRGVSKIRSITKSTKLAGMTCHPIDKAVMK